MLEQILPENISTFVSDITVDSDDNVWICTDGGAGVFRIADSTWTALRTRFASDVHDYERTDLVTELLYAVGYNPVTADVWFCGEGGISVLHTGAGGDGAGEDLLAYPNPYIWSGMANDIAIITHVPPDADLHIYSADGSLVRTIPLIDRTSLSTAEWNGRNQSGEPVASGVYILVAPSGSGIVRGKIAFIRED